MKKICIMFLTLLMSNVNAETYWGEKVPVGLGHAATFIKTYKKQPRELGIAITPEALKNLPHTMQEFTLPMPTEYKVEPYKHITLDWNPHGHEPDGVYNLPHFDMHFYFIRQEERKSISCMNEDAANCHMPPMADYIPDHYGATPQGVPHMGWHWVDLLAPEFNGGLFSRTFLYGYYKGAPIFLEPMVTLDYLCSKQTSEKEIRLPAKFPQENGHYPAGYKVYFDKTENLHKIVLKDFQDEGP